MKDRKESKHKDKEKIITDNKDKDKNEVILTETETETESVVGNEKCKVVEKHTEPETELVSETKPKSETEMLTEKINQLKTEIKEKNDIIHQYFTQILRLRAEFDNYRKRVEKEKEEKFIQGKIDTITHIISLIDVLDNATKMVKEKTDTKKDSVMKGLELIYKEFINFLSKEGVNEIYPITCKVDLRYHEIIDTTENEELEDGTIVEVLQKGYTYLDKIIRPAKVKVVKNVRAEISKSASAETKENTNTEDEDNPCFN